MYCCILMDSSHSDTVRKGTPSEPLVLGSLMDTLQHARPPSGQGCTPSPA